MRIYLMEILDSLKMFTGLLDKSYRSLTQQTINTKKIFIEATTLQFGIKVQKFFNTKRISKKTTDLNLTFNKMNVI